MGKQSKKQGAVAESAKKIKNVGDFVKNGFSVFHSASKNKYNRKSETIEALRKEMMNTSFKTIFDDKKNLIGDRRAISNDVRSAFNKIILKNDQAGA
jgi:hypothetical protein